MALAFGFLIPASIIYLRGLLDHSIHNKLGLEKVIGEFPVLAELPKIGKKEGLMVKNEDRSVLTEAMRILRTNLDYVLKSKKQDRIGNVIFVTSSFPGEGKTLV